jgi:hypothetical protein
MAGGEPFRRIPGCRRQFRGAVERGLRFLVGEPLRPLHRLAVRGLKVQPALALRLGLDLLRLRELREQRLRLRDLRHFGRGREAFKRGREDGVGFDGASGRLVQLR